MSQDLQIVKTQKEIISTTMTASRLGEALVDENNKRNLINKYIQENLISGVDFGKIKINGRDSKYCLFKSGAEKVCSLLHLKPIFKIDNDIKSIVGTDVIPFICELVNRHTGEIEGEGRGACSLKEKQGNANVAIKIAQKRAQIDAVLRVAALSDQFTQDLEDMSVSERPSIVPPAPPQKKEIKINSMAELSAYTTDQSPPVWGDETNDDAHIIEDNAVCNFGKNKGKRWAELTANQLNWYKNFLMDQINDATKEKYKSGNEAALSGVMNAIENLEGM